VTCPFCGQTDNITEKDPTAQKCSKCGHGMKQTPNQDAHVGLQGGEAFGDASFPDSCFAYVPDSAKGSDGKKSDRKLPYKNADGSVDLAHVRNALARLNQTDGISADEKARIQTMLQNILKRESPEYNPEEMLAKLLKESAAQKAENLKLQEQVETVEKEKKKLQEEIRVQAGKLSDYEFDLKQRESKLKSLDESYQQLHKDFLRVDTERKFAFKERDEVQVKLAAEVQSKMNAIKEQSNLQIECAEANERVSKTASENLELSKKLAEYSRKVNDKDKVIAEKEKALSEKDADLTKMNDKVKKALRFQSWAWKELQKAGVAVVESAES
jgi:chromosome segregation ATPase